MNMQHLCRTLGCGPDGLLPEWWEMVSCNPIRHDYSQELIYTGPASLDDPRAILLAGPMIAKLSPRKTARFWRNEQYWFVGCFKFRNDGEKSLPAALHAALVSAGVLEAQP